VPLLLPLVGEQDNHEALSETVQLVFEVTVIGKLPAVLGTDWVVGDIERFGTAG